MSQIPIPRVELSEDELFDFAPRQIRSLKRTLPISDIDSKRIKMAAPESMSMLSDPAPVMGPKPFSLYYKDTGKVRYQYLDKKPYTVAGQDYHVVHPKPVFVNSTTKEPVPMGSDLWTQLVKAYYKRAASAKKKVVKKKKKKYYRKKRYYRSSGGNNLLGGLLLKALTGSAGGQQPTILKL